MSVIWRKFLLTTQKICQPGLYRRGLKENNTKRLVFLTAVWTHGDGPEVVGIECIGDLGVTNDAAAHTTPPSLGDSLVFRFTKFMLEGKPIDVYNYGEMKRDFTYIDDIVDGIISAINTPLEFEVINLGCGQPIGLMEFISCLEETLGVNAKKNMMEMQPGEVRVTWADISKAQDILEYNSGVKLW